MGRAGMSCTDEVGGGIVQRQYIRAGDEIVLKKVVIFFNHI